MAITVVELRQYTLLPGRRDELIDVFDRELVETQEACGMTVLGQFRDEDRPDWDDVLLLEPLRLPVIGERAAGHRPPEQVHVTVHERAHAPDEDGALAMLVTLDADNTFPALPLRTDGDYVVRVGRTAPSTPSVQAIRATCTGRSLLP